jgi:hypothetical protein
MAKLSGRWCSIFFKGYDLTGNSRQFNIEPGFLPDDVTAFQDNVENSIPDVAQCKASLTAYLNPATDQSHTALKTPGSYTDQVLMILFGQNLAPVIGDPAFAMLCKQFSYATPLAVKSAIVADATFECGLYRPDFGVVQANTTITNTTNFASVNNGAATASGGTAYLECLGVLAADTYQVKIQHSTNDSVWADLGSAFTINGATRNSQRISFTGAINQYTRAVATRTGAAGNSFRLAVTFTRYLP